MSSAVPEATPIESREMGLRRLGRIGFFFPVGGLIVLVFAVMAFFPGLVAHYNPDEIYIGPKFAPPSGQFWFGTDEVGRDLFARVVYGTRISLGMSLAVVAIGGAVGVAIGAVAGFIGGFVDEVLMRLVDLFLSLPSFILAIAIAAVLGRSTSSVVVALAIVWWPGYARLIRGIVLNVKSRLHVESARALGASPVYIVWRHILPFTLNQLNARLTQDMGYALVSVAGLSFLGLGAQPPSPEWGVLLNSGRDYIVQAWWYAVFPGLAITIWTLGVAMLGDAISGRGRGTRVG